MKAQPLPSVKPFEVPVISEQMTALFHMLRGADIPGTTEVEKELLVIRDLAISMGVDPGRILMDRTLARGLDYYTGPVFEVILTDADIGSVCGGGRYDGLVGMFSGRAVPAVGLSLGVERLLVIMEERNMFSEKNPCAHVFVTVFSTELRLASLSLAQELREAGLKARMSYRVGKLGKQFKEADKRGIRYVTVLGPDDQEGGKIQLKDLTTGEQMSGDVDTVVAYISQQVG